MITITAEQFALTPAIRAHVELNIDKLGAVLPSNASIEVFLSEPAPKKFSVLCKIRLWRKDFVVRESNSNLYKAVEIARHNLTRQIVDEKHRWVRLRRRASRVSPQHPSAA